FGHTSQGGVASGAREGLVDWFSPRACPKSSNETNRETSMNRDVRPFSRRFGYSAPAQEITVREDAPEALRQAVVMLADHLELSPSIMRYLVCRLLLEKKNPSNWSEYPNIFGEVQWLVECCPWHKVYDRGVA